MARTKQTARASTGGLAPRKQLAASCSPRAPQPPFVLSGCTGYAAHMNGIYAWRAAGGECFGWKPTSHETFRCVENPRISISFMGPSKTGVESSLLEKMDEVQAAELQAANEFSGWVAQWNEARGLRRG